MDRIFAQVENGSTSAIPKGALCVWDLTDNRAISGILADTFGLRVTIAPAGYTASTAFNKAGVAAAAMPITVAGTRGAIYPMIVYGPCDYTLVNITAAGDAIPGGLAVVASDAAGYASGAEDQTNFGTITPQEQCKAFGFFRDVIAAPGTATTGTVFVKCLGVAG